MKILLNNIPWTIKRVDEDNPRLLKADACGVSSEIDKKILISKEFHGEFLFQVIVHELTHATFDGVHITLEKNTYTEEEVCVFMENNANNIVTLAHKVFDVWNAEDKDAKKKHRKDY